MRRTAIILTAFILTSAGIVTAQRPPRPAGPPGGEMGGPPRAGAPMRPDGDRGPGWQKAVDSNHDQKIDLAEITAAADSTFDELDKDHNGTLEASEVRPAGRPGPAAEGQRPPREGNGRPGMAPEARPDARPEQKGRLMLPPFFFMKSIGANTTTSKAEFEAAVRTTFTEMDKNKDGFLTKEEMRPENGAPRGDRPEGPPPPPQAQFIGAEMRFGDKFVKGQPFSADTVIEDNRRLYDGSTVTKSLKGAIYRDGAGRVRREQPLDNFGGVSVGDSSKPQMLVFIDDFAAKTHYFLDVNSKTARSSMVGDARAPRAENEGPAEAKTESLGTKSIEGVECEGTRTTFEIPAGQFGNAAPIQVVSEKWFSKDLQLVVLSRHVDPLAGEHVFKLVNIKRTEPSADLFTVPADFKVLEKR